MRILPALLLLLTITQAFTTCIHDVQRVNPTFDALVDPSGQITWVANKKTLALFQKCMRDHGHNIEGHTLSFEMPS
jgi:hypothetical protein